MARLIPMLLLALLAACAPATLGSSARHPLPLGDVPLEVTPGSSVHVLVTHQLDQLGFRPSDMAPVLFRSESTSRASGPADNWMSLTPVRVPAHWQVRLEAARFVQETAGAGHRTTVQSVIRVDVPQTSALGEQQVRVQLNGRRGSAPVTINLRVRQR